MELQQYEVAVERKNPQGAQTKGKGKEKGPSMKKYTAPDPPAQGKGFSKGDNDLWREAHNSGGAQSSNSQETNTVGKKGEEIVSPTPERRTLNLSLIHI